MNVNFNPQLNNTKKSSEKINFNGMSLLLGSQSVKAFLKKTQILGDVVLQKKQPDGSFQPAIVSLVQTKSGKKGDKETKFLFGLFEKNFENATSLKELDSKELGLMEVKYKNLTTVPIPQENNFFSKTAREMLSKYKDALKVLYLVSLEGDKYKYIGTKLLDAAVDFSKKIGTKGRIFLVADNDIPIEYLKVGAKYHQLRANSSPVSFYYKYGLRADNETNKLIEQTPNTTLQNIIMYLPETKSKN